MSRGREQALGADRGSLAVAEGLRLDAGTADDVAERSERARRWRLIGAVIGAAAGGGLALASGAGLLEVVRLLVLGGALTAVAICDATERRIPNRIVLPAAGVCGALALAGGPHLALLGALGLVALLLLLSLLRPGSLGMGDVKLVLLIGLGLDGHVLAALVLGGALAALGGLLLLVRNGRAAWRTSLPLAPFLAAGVLGALLASSLA